MHTISPIDISTTNFISYRFNTSVHWLLLLVGGLLVDLLLLEPCVLLGCAAISCQMWRAPLYINECVKRFKGLGLLQAVGNFGGGAGDACSDSVGTHGYIKSSYIKSSAVSAAFKTTTGQMYIYRPRGLVESESQTQAVTAADSQDMSNRDKHYPHYASSLHLSNSYEYILKLTRCQRQSIQTNVFNVSLSIVQSVAQNSFLHLVVIFSVVVAEMDFRSWMVEMAWAARPLTSFIHTQAAPESASLFHLHDKVYKALKASANSNNHFHSSKNHLHFKIYKALKPSATTNWLKMPLIKI